ncbi:MAG: hypothetical protein IJ756_00890 [Paludibacteraceae bacterium]|nr:hypothetical protein [Paludibacteraceae bacterium]
MPPPYWVLRRCNNYLLSLNKRSEDWLVSDDDPGIFSCHQAVRKDRFIRAGGYNPDIVNGEWIGDNETGLNIKLKKLGGRFAYNGKAVIHHQIPANRMTQEYLNRRLANQGNCDSYTDFRKYRYSEKELKRQNLNFKKKMILRLWQSIKLLIGQNDLWHLKLAECFYYRNRIRYNNKLMNNSEWKKMVLKDNWID